MKLLLIHSDFIEYEPKKKAIDAAEKSPQKSRIDECLVVFFATEKDDKDSVVKHAAKEIRGVAKQVDCGKIVLYPFVHLTQQPSSPATALRILDNLQSELKDLLVYRSPFGWYKSFNIKCKGHPLAELSREIKSVPDEVSEAVKKEEEITSEWFILEPDGKMNKIMMKGRIVGFDFSKHKNLEKFVNYEMKKSRIVDKEPPHIKLMRKLELVTYEEASDPGHFRFLPKGKLIKSLIEEYVTKKVIDYGAQEVETPIMYDYEHESLKSYLNRFPARQYTIQTPNKKVFTRFSACFGQFLTLKDANISYRNLPLSIYELASSFRVEQRGELAGMRRLRKFTMPDCHCLVKDFEQAKTELMRRFILGIDVTKGLGITKDDFEVAIRIVRNFYEDHKDLVLNLVKKWKKPVLLELWDKKFFYFVFKYEFNFIDALEKAAALTTDQIDVENAKRFGIEYTDVDNTRKNPFILHLSPSGAIERVIYALLEKAYMKDPNKSLLPLWLSPTQVRLCPINDKFNSYAKKIADEIAKEGIRVDIDDRTESIGKKIRDAEMEWIHLIVVLGKKEKKSKKLAVRFRKLGNKKPKIMTTKSLVKQIKKETKGFPFKKLSLPRNLSQRPVYIG